MINPATEGTIEILPAFTFSSVLSIILIGSSFEYITLSFLIPLFFNSFLITFASGHTLVFYISVTSNLVGSSLLPVPIHEIIGIFNLFPLITSSILAVTVSIQSIM